MSEIVSIREASVSYETCFYFPSLRDLVISRGKNKVRQKIQALRNVTVSLRAGEILGVIGRNGSGKSTLCRLAAGTLKPISGSVRTTTDIRVVGSEGGVIEQELTGRENAFLLANLFFPHCDPYELSEDIIEFSELGHFADAPVRAYSRGMLSRLVVGASTLRPASLLVVDEALGGGDGAFIPKVQKRFHKVISNSGASLIVSHNSLLLQHLCTRLLVLDRGEVVFDGDTEEGVKFYDRLVYESDSQGAAIAGTAEYFGGETGVFDL